MPHSLNLAIFGSTKGTDLQAVIDAIKSGELIGVDLKFVLSNKLDSYILERARQAGFKTIFLDPKGRTREVYDAECLRLCQEYHVDLILFIGYMRLVTKTLIEPYRNRILNIHPSLLPKYPGMDLDVHKAVLDAGEKETGCTLHFVDEGTDTGPIFVQRRLAINPDDTPEALKERVQKLEQDVIIEGIKKFNVI
jgi:phosphoribosylglycinamide formyltransferase-1